MEGFVVVLVQSRPGYGPIFVEFTVSLTSMVSLYTLVLRTPSQ